MCKFGLYEVFKVQYAGMISEETAYTYRTVLYLAASASAEFFADIALSPMEAAKVLKISYLLIILNCFLSTYGYNILSGSHPNYAWFRQHVARSFTQDDPS